MAHSHGIGCLLISFTRFCCNALINIIQGDFKPMELVFFQFFFSWILPTPRFSIVFLVLICSLTLWTPDESTLQHGFHFAMLYLLYIGWFCTSKWGTLHFWCPHKMPFLPNTPWTFFHFDSLRKHIYYTSKLLYNKFPSVSNLFSS